MPLHPSPLSALLAHRGAAAAAAAALGAALAPALYALTPPLSTRFYLALAAAAAALFVALALAGAWARRVVACYYGAPLLVDAEGLAGAPSFWQRLHAALLHALAAGELARALRGAPPRALSAGANARGGVRLAARRAPPGLAAALAQLGASAEEELPLVTRLIAEPVMLTEAESKATSQEVSDAAKGGAAAGSAGLGETPLAVPAQGDRVAVVATLRMGYGHHRLALAAASWLQALGDFDSVYLHDLLSVESPEAAILARTETVYSRLSRTATAAGGVFEALWSALTSHGGVSALRVSNLLARRLAPLMAALPRRAPVVATHCLAAMAALEAGCDNVINLVIDNHAQWFVCVPGALNLVQGPATYAALLRMGLPAEQVALAGHWAPRALVECAAADCKRRIARIAHAESSRAQPLMLLVPAGGAGAQGALLAAFTREVLPYVRRREVCLLLNAGDHATMRRAFEEAVGPELLGANVITSLERCTQFSRALRAGAAAPPVTLFAFADEEEARFAAVVATDLLCRAADVLCVKPSELAFWPLPKLMMRRVGGHEAASAVRAAELGDGTPELRTAYEAAEFVGLLLRAPELLVAMNERVAANATAGVYDGCLEAAVAARAAIDQAAREPHLPATAE